MSIPRRRFLRAGGALAASSLVFPSIVKAENLGSQKLRVAVIGVGGRGRSHVSELMSEELVAFCDVDDDRAAQTFRRYPKVPRFKDFRVMFDKMGKNLDAVSIAAPDHMHYPIALWAIAHGKHILVEKPLVRTVEEAVLLKRAAKESGVVSQMGNQGHAGDGLRVIQEWIAAGLIGEVNESYHWTNRPIWPQGMKNYNSVVPVPTNLDWDLWQGVAPAIEYRDGIAPFAWRRYRNYGCGAVGDIACHSMDSVYTTLGLGYPVSVKSTSNGMTGLAYPESSTVDFEFRKPGSGDRFVAHWMDGCWIPREVPFVPEAFYRDALNADGSRKGAFLGGSFIVGTKGTIVCDMYSGRPMILPQDYFKQLRQDRALPEKSLPRVKGGHFKEWVDCIKQGKQPGANIVDYAADFTATALLGAVSLSFEEKLGFDSDARSFTGNAEANELLKSQYEYREEFLPS